MYLLVVYLVYVFSSSYFHLWAPSGCAFHFRLSSLYLFQNCRLPNVHYNVEYAVLFTRTYSRERTPFQCCSVRLAFSKRADMKLGERSCVLICQTPSIVFEFGLLMHRETISYSVSFPHEGEFMSSSSYEDQLFGSVVRMLFDFGREEGRSKNTSSKTNYDQRIFCSKVPCQKKAVSEIRRIVHFSFPKFPRRIVTQLSCSRCF